MKKEPWQLFECRTENPEETIQVTPLPPQVHNELVWLQAKAHGDESAARAIEREDPALKGRFLWTILEIEKQCANESAKRVAWRYAVAAYLESLVQSAHGECR